MAYALAKTYKTRSGAEKKAKSLPSDLKAKVVERNGRYWVYVQNVRVR
jgi:hypothetical protein